MVRFVVGVPDHDVQERPMFDIQDLIQIVHHLMVLPDHPLCTAVPIPPPWLEVIGNLFHRLNQ